MANLLEKVTDMNNQILQGKALEAFEQYYHKDISMQENDSEPTVGKDANREREIEFFGNIVEFRGAEVKNVAVGENTTMVEWYFDYLHKEWGERQYHQVAVQEWQDGLIIKETFYYGG